jgi:hypothetical protein
MSIKENMIKLYRSDHFTFHSREEELGLQNEAFLCDGRSRKRFNIFYIKMHIQVHSNILKKHRKTKQEVSKSLNF